MAINANGNCSLFLLNIEIQHQNVRVRQHKETSQIGPYKAKSDHKGKLWGNPDTQSVPKTEKLKFPLLMMKITLEMAEIEIQHLSMRLRQP